MKRKHFATETLLLRLLNMSDRQREFIYFIRTIGDNSVDNSCVSCVYKRIFISKTFESNRLLKY